VLVKNISVYRALAQRAHYKVPDFQCRALY